MRRALSASLLLHIGALGSAYLLFVGARPPDQAGVESMTVDLIPIVATTNVTADQAEVEATTAQVSAGADEVVLAEAEPIETLQPVEAEAAVLRRLDGIDAEDPEEPAHAEAQAATEPLDAEPFDGIEVAAVAAPASMPLPAEALEPRREPLEQVMTAAAITRTLVEADMPAPLAVTDEPAAELSSPPVEPAEVAEPVDAAAPAAPDDVATDAKMEVALAEPMEGIKVPEVTEDLELPPVPRPKTVTQTSQPTYPGDPPPKTQDPPKETKAADKPADKKAADKPTPKKEKVANVGNGGANQADANAGKASGGKGKKAEPGNAEISTYEGLVRRHLGRKAKMGKVGKGSVLVSFVIGKGGNVKSVSVARSSGNAKLDSAAIANVKRAAPYPPIPDELGKASWSFNIPMDGDR